MPESYPSHWPAEEKSTAKQIEELIEAARQAVKALRIERYFATAARLEEALSVVEKTPVRG